MLKLHSEHNEQDVQPDYIPPANQEAPDLWAQLDDELGLSGSVVPDMSSEGISKPADSPIKLDIFRQMTYTGQELMAAELAETNWAIQGLLPSGLTILAGKPKLGKSWLVLNWLICKAVGTKIMGQIPTECGDVLYLALEDNPSRLRERIESMTGTWDVAPVLSRLHLANKWMRLDDNGLTDLRNKITQYKDTLKLVVIDTLARIRPHRSGNGSLYDEDYASLTGLKQLADEFGIAIIVVHHTRKTESDDPLEMVSGTNGLVGAADNVMVLKRESGRHDATLYVRGRDVAEQELALQWDVAGASWNLLGNADDYRLQDSLKADILAALKNAGEPLGPKALAKYMGRLADYSSIKTALWRMAHEGLVLPCKGQYALKGGDAPAP